MKSGTFSPFVQPMGSWGLRLGSVNPHRSRQLSLENFWPAKRIFCLYYRFQVSELCCFLSPLWKEGKKNNTLFFFLPQNQRKWLWQRAFALQNIKQAAWSLLAQASGTVQITRLILPAEWPLPHPTPPPQHYRLSDMAIAHHYRDSYRHPSHRDLRDRNRPMGKTEGSLQFLGDGVLQTCILTAQLNFRLEICDGVNASSWSNVSFMKLRWC